MVTEDNSEKTSADSQHPLESENGDSGLEQEPARPAGFRRAWKKLDLDLELVLMMAKGGLPPAIAAAVFQDTSVAKAFTTLSYLVCLMAFFSFATLPRARFIQTMLLNILGVCILSGSTTLAIFCAVKARENTQSPEDAARLRTATTPLDVPYNSSASAVIALWLCFTIYLINILRAAKPQLGVTGTILSFYTIVVCVNATRVPHMKQGLALTRRMIGAFLTGFAIAVGVSFLIFPRSSRINCFKLTGVYITHLKESLKAQGHYMRRMRRKNIIFTCVQETNVSVSKREAKAIRNNCSPEAAKLKAATGSLSEVFGNMHTELHFAKQEMAYGRLDAYDIKKLYDMLQTILLPMNGMSTLVDVLKELAIRAAPAEDEPNSVELEFDEMKVESDAWRAVMDSLLDSFDGLAGALEDSLDHTYYALRFKEHKRRNKILKNHVDAEKGNLSPGPNHKNFTAHLTTRIDEFDRSRTRTLETWSRAAGVTLPPAFLTDPSQEAVNVLPKHHGGSHRLRKDQQRLYLVLYIEFLTWSVAKGILDLVSFADCKSEEALLRGRRLILPGRKRLMKWIKTFLHSTDCTPDPTVDGNASSRTMVTLGAAYKMRKDPEHLPPTSHIERIGDQIRRVSHFFASPESAFGFRAVCAVMTVAIIAFLRETQSWFLQQRGLWAVIVVSISMASTTGASIFGFLGRLIGTICASITSITLWYIAGGKRGAVIPLLWLFVSLGLYFTFKFPQWSIGALLFNVTQLLIVGYELEVSKLGGFTVTSNGQLYYPIYLLAPYRLATVIAGTFVAFFWSYFPYPNTTHGKLRTELGNTLYLLANYYSTVHSTVELRLLDDKPFDVTIKGSPARKLEKARTRVFAKTGIQLSKLRALAAEWEPVLGGKFPAETYDEIIRSMQNIFNYMTLISYGTRTFSPQQFPSYSRVHLSQSTSECDPEPWIRTFRTFVRSLTITSHSITSMLSLLSASVTNGLSLPPYLRVPAPNHLGEQLQTVSPEILGIEHMTEPCYSAFAVCQIASSLVSEELERLVGLVKGLVGEVDFSFHVVSTGDGESIMGDGVRGKGKME